VEIGTLPSSPRGGIARGMELPAPEGRRVSPDVETVARKAGERLRRDPGDADAMFALAASRVAFGRADDALSLLNRLLRVRVDYPGLWELKRQLHEALGEKVAAAACARAADLYRDG